MTFYLVLCDSIFEPSRYYDPTFDTSIGLKNDTGEGWGEYRGREAIHRLMVAYDFKSRQQLCDHLGASKSTMANRYLRDSFPAEWVIQCALETGVSLLWLTTGQGEPGAKIDDKKSINFVNSSKIKPLSELVSPEIDKVTLVGGSLVEAGKAIIDSSLLPLTQASCFS